MKATFEQSLLAAALKLASAATDVNGHAYALLLLEAAPGHVGVAGASWNRQTRVAVPAQVEAVGVVAVDAARLTDVVVRLKGEPAVTLTAHPAERGHGPRLRVTTSSGFSLWLKTEEPHVVPDRPETTSTVEIDGKTLAGMLRACRHAVAVTADLYPMSGISLASRPPWLRAAASDNRRIAEARVALPADMPDILLPPGFAMELAGFCETMDGPVTLRAGPKTVEVAIGAITIQSGLIDAAFPNYQKIVDRCVGPGTRMIIARKAFSLALERIATVAGSKERDNLVVAMHPPHELPEWLMLSTSHDGQPSGTMVGRMTTETAPQEHATGAVMHQLAEALKALSAESVELFLPANRSTPFTLTQTEPSITTYISPSILKAG